MTKEVTQQDNIEESHQEKLKGRQQSNFFIEILHIVKVKYTSHGTYGAKTIFISIVTVMFLAYAFFILKIPFGQCIVAISALTLIFLILWTFGCDEKNCETDFVQTENNNI